MVIKNQMTFQHAIKERVLTLENYAVGFKLNAVECDVFLDNHGKDLFIRLHTYVYTEKLRDTSVYEYKVYSTWLDHLKHDLIKKYPKLKKYLTFKQDTKGFFVESNFYVKYPKFMPANKQQHVVVTEIVSMKEVE